MPWPALVATQHPEMVKAVVFAASQASKVPPDITQAPFIAGDLTRPESERLAVLRKAFFAPGHDGPQWLGGWHPDTLRMQREAAAAVPRSDYVGCGTAMVLEVFGAADPFKPKECWHKLRETLGDRVETIVIENRIARTVSRTATCDRDGNPALPCPTLKSLHRRQGLLRERTNGTRSDLP